MAFSYGWRGPNIVKDGLILYVDAGSPNSFPLVNSSTTWKDISGNANNGTLVNGPTFNSGNGGAIVFDGSDDYVNLGINPSCYSPTGFTIDSWVKLTNNAGINPILAIYNSATITSGNEYIFGTTNSRLYGWVYDLTNVAYRGRYVTSTSFIANNTWCNLHMVYDGGTANSSVKLYINGVQRDAVDFGFGTFVSIRNTSSPMAIGVRNSGLGNGTLNGSMASLKYYTRALSAQEIIQNYNAVKTRFGL
jgi:hypothetical protein